MPKATNSTPYELRGVWRGYAIQNNFGAGEWVAIITKNSTKVLKPDGSIYFSGLTKTYKPLEGGTIAQLWITSTKGDITGPIKLLYNNYELAPELGYVALAIDERAPTVPPTSYDAAMTSTDNKVLGMYKCKSANCEFVEPNSRKALSVELLPAARHVQPVRFMQVVYRGQRRLHHLRLVHRTSRVHQLLQHSQVPVRRLVK